MRETLTTLAAGMAGLFVAGCSSVPPQGAALNPQLACIKGEMHLNLLTAVAGGGSHAALRTHSRSGPGAYDRYCFAPGEVTVHVSAQNQPAWASACTTFPLLGGHEYRTRARLESGLFTYQVLDVTQEPAVPVHEVRLPVGTHADCPADKTYSQPAP